MGARMCPGWTARSYETRTQREDNLVLLRALTRSCYFSALFWFAYVDPKESLMNEYGVVLGTGNTALHAIIQAKRVSNCYIQEKKTVRLCVWMFD